jgi:endonuclease/exonuclease/phosphatase family metal-dependent hydrolase
MPAIAGRARFTESAMNIRLISWNLHGIPFLARRRERMMTALMATLERRPDIVAFQEVWGDADARQISERADAELMRTVKVPGVYSSPPGGLVVLYRDAVWQVLRHEFRHYEAHGPAWRLWEGDGVAGKGIQHVRLLHRETRSEFSLLNTHLQSQYPEYNRLYERERESQIQQLAATASEVSGGRPVIGVGDFNTLPSERLYGVLTTSWCDMTIKARAAAGKRATTYEDGGGGAWLDYVLGRRDPGCAFDADVRLLRNARRDDPFSDHHGLAATVSLIGVSDCGESRPNRLRELGLRFVSDAPATRRQWIREVGRIPFSDA